MVQKSSPCESYDEQSKRICSADSLQASQLGHSRDPPPNHAHSTPQTTQAMPGT